MTGSNSGRRAVVDVGTISVRLLVADLEGEGLRTLERRTEITRLGEKLKPGGHLDPEAARRTAETVRQFVEVARQWGAEAIWLAGTSATREARDGRSFVAELAGRLGVDGRVLTGEQEAALAYAGVCVDIPGDPLVLDIGGGSTELIRGISREQQAGLSSPGRAHQPVSVRALPEVRAISLPLGASRSTERWVRSDPPTGGAKRQILAESGTLFSAAPKNFAGVAGPLVGVAGTVTTLACLDAGLTSYDSRLLHGRRLTREAVCHWADLLSSLPTREVAALPCVQPGRAPVLAAGALILQAALDALERSELIVSERDLLDGLALCGLPLCPR